jgi:hypothetical protein
MSSEFKSPFNRGFLAVESAFVFLGCEIASKSAETPVLVDSFVEFSVASERHLSESSVDQSEN